MTFSYLFALSSPKDQLRMMLGDIDPSNPLFQDEEINGLYIVNDDQIFPTAIGLAMSVAARYSRKASLNIDGFSAAYKEVSANFTELAQQFRKQASEVPSGAPVVTGTSLSEMQSMDSDPDRTPSQFEVGMQDDNVVTGYFSNGTSGSNW